MGNSLLKRKFHFSKFKVHVFAGQFEVEVVRLIKIAMETDSIALQMEDLNSYISKQLLMLHSHLPSEVFSQVLNIFHRHILESFLNIVEGEIQVILR